MAATRRDARPEIVLETARAQAVVKDDETLVLAPAGSNRRLRLKGVFQFVVVEDRLDVLILTDDVSPDLCEGGWSLSRRAPTRISGPWRGFAGGES